MTVYAHSIWDDTAPHVDENGNDIWPDGSPWYPVTRPQDGSGASTMPEEYQHIPDYLPLHPVPYDSPEWDHETPCEYCGRPTHKGYGECYPNMVGLDCTDVTEDGWIPKDRTYTCDICKQEYRKIGHGRPSGWSFRYVPSLIRRNGKVVAYCDQCSADHLD